MLILEPTLVNQTITIAPRSESIIGTFVLNIRKDGDGKTESITNATLNTVTNFVEVTFASTIFDEDSTYYLEITKDSDLWYRDKIYVTSQTAQERVTNKHEIGNGTIYQSYDSTDDNTYII